ncbi:MAG: efflux RND transporter periplasmic adaptor subunit, partial [Fidelibacterota bacterium]
NPHLDLKPGMYANVQIETSPLRNVVAVPMEAVLFSGERNVVFVSLPGGRFAPRDVTIGIESGDGFYEVKEGLSEGETVVTSGQFLLDSESKLQESIAKLLQVKSPDRQRPEEPGMEEHHDHEADQEVERDSLPSQQHKEHEEEMHNHEMDMPSGTTSMEPMEGSR